MKKNLLANLLSVLIDNFGYDKVRSALDGMLPRQSGNITRKVARVRVARPKPDAVAAVAAMNLENAEKRDFLAHLAEDYEAKRFMPNVNHVRSFLMHEHDNPALIKSRQQVTVKVFKKLAAMDLKELRELEFCGAYGPPKRLATYAEAIENFGRHLRNSR